MARAGTVQASLVQARAAVLRQTNAPMTIDTIEVGPLAAGDVPVRVRAASLCHTDLEAIEGQLAVKLPAMLGHEAAGEVVEAGADVTDLGVGDRVVLSWNPHCGHCFYCEQAQPILCAQFLANGPKAFHFDGRPRLSCDAVSAHQLMYLGGFAEYCVVPAQSAIRVPEAMPFDRAALLGCGVMTGVGAIIACDPNPARRQLASMLGATHAVLSDAAETVALARSLTAGRGADVVNEAAGVPAFGFRLALEAVRPGGQVVWLGKTGVGAEVAFRWGRLMQEKHITRSSYGGARPAQDFPLLAQTYLDGRLNLDDMISARIGLADINEGFAALKRGETVRSVIMLAGAV